MKKGPGHGFASDNGSGVHPDVMDALVKANSGHVTGYGDDPYTEAAVETFRGVYGSEIDVYFVFNGTGANVSVLSALTRSYNSVICAKAAHVDVDECGALENAAGCKLIALPSEDGKIAPEQLDKFRQLKGVVHHPQPAGITITQATEWGTIYTPDELKALCSYCHDNGLFVHMDGARLANAAVSLKTGLREITGNAGVDVLSFGGTKNGLMFGEAVVFFNRDLAGHYEFHRKQGCQLASKMRYISVQFDTLLKNDLWRRNAANANRTAALLAEKLSVFPEVRFLHPVQANGIFAELPKEIIPALQDKYFFYEMDPDTGMCRFMCSFDTTEEDVNGFINALTEIIGV